MALEVPVAAEGIQHQWHSRVGVQYKFSVECLGHSCSVVLVGRYHDVTVYCAGISKYHFNG